MGIGFILFGGGVIGLIVATIASAVLQHKVDALNGLNSYSRGSLRSTVSLFPFGCLAWAAVVFLFQAVVNEQLLGRDPGLGDSFRCPLPNGYALEFVDVTDIGWLLWNDLPVTHGVRRLQVSGSYALGGRDTVEHIGYRGDTVDEYFLIDMQNGEWRTFDNIPALQTVAELRNIKLDLRTVGALYRRYRWGWFDLFALILLTAPPVLIGYRLLVRPWPAQR